MNHPLNYAHRLCLLFAAVGIGRRIYCACDWTKTLSAPITKHIVANCVPPTLSDPNMMTGRLLEQLERGKAYDSLASDILQSLERYYFDRIGVDCCLLPLSFSGAWNPICLAGTKARRGYYKPKLAFPPNPKSELLNVDLNMERWLQSTVAASLRMKQHNNFFGGGAVSKLDTEHVALSGFGGDKDVSQ
jgi:hypothetical protein